MTEAMRIEVSFTRRQSQEEQLLLDILVTEFERLDHRILCELMAGGDFLHAARDAFKAKNRIRRFLADRPGVQVARRLAPALSKLRDNEGYHVDEFERLLRIGASTEVDWDEVVFVDGPDTRQLRYDGTA